MAIWIILIPFLDVIRGPWTVSISVSEFFGSNSTNYIVFKNCFVGFAGKKIILIRVFYSCELSMEQRRKLTFCVLLVGKYTVSEIVVAYLSTVGHFLNKTELCWELD